MNYFEEIKKSLVAKGAKGSITKDSVFKAMGLDSLDLMDMIVLLEDELNITFSDEQMSDINTVNDLITTIEELVK
ncbi:acyl carrier protein [Spiroplasma chinense]|uniref:Acyl carrier protein n=1 Tax=Spiroplasma chinense TaxID=216932 RepID=A0A5B9Y5L6_9MOLU|nr:phosphopantetheine-binding protein [Spiroplasma chinense]QEH62240.1 acyl carrier protein [Spiroplasma chinense]